MVLSAQISTAQFTFCNSWEPEYLAAMDFISPPNAEAQSFTLERRKLNNEEIHLTLRVHIYVQV